MPQTSLTSPVRVIPTDARSPGPEKAIALCLSGGGYRAMIFHLGALWRLNEAGLLPKLRRVSSVSGGSIVAGVLGARWKRLEFDSSTGVSAQFKPLVVDAIRELARRTIDEDSILGGLLLPGVSANDRLIKLYDRHIFHGATLEDLPADDAGPRFVINATNVQTGSLWRFSRPYMGDYQVGLIPNPRITIATAVAASSAFPPVLSPCVVDVDSQAFDPPTRGSLYAAPFNDQVVLSDGGVYDNLGLETAFKRCTSLLVSDGGMSMAAQAEPKGDWARHAVRTLEIIDNQVRALRKRQLIHSFTQRDRTGAYWGIASNFVDYDVSDPLGIRKANTAPLAAIGTRLRRLESCVQDKLINWGYAICDAGLRKHCREFLTKDYGIDIVESKQLPYPAAES